MISGLMILIVCFLWHLPSSKSIYAYTLENAHTELEEKYKEEHEEVERAVTPEKSQKIQ